MREAETLLARFPGPVTIQPNRLRFLIALPVSIGLTVFSVYLLRQAIEAWSSDVIRASLAIVVCGGFAVAFVMLLLPGGMRLTLDADGFETVRFFRRVRVSWRNVAGVRVEEKENEVKWRQVFFDTTERGKKVSRALPLGYALPVDDLAWLLAQWRERALVLPRTTSVPPAGSRGA